jgi:hypothetical protein
MHEADLRVRTFSHVGFVVKNREQIDYHLQIYSPFRSAQSRAVLKNDTFYKMFTNCGGIIAVPIFENPNWPTNSQYF